ncbi:hypothetical protein F4803DRAFT_554497 [Xylaria telfairii]|nr:hypothetical protein F4803DRAFT_554497 [Xylaria telfairii]
MSVLSPMHEMTIRSSDTPPMALANKQQPYDNRSPVLGSSEEILNKPITLPNPPRPPTPGPPPRYPPIPPHPPVPTPPPSPRNANPLTVCSNSNSSPQQLSTMLASVSVPGVHQCPYPNPPPSPGPRRPGPRNPRPDVPTPPPSPRRSMDTNDPWIFFSAASTIAILVLEYLSSTTWHGQGGAAHEDDVSTAARDDMTYAPNDATRCKGSRLVHEVAQSVTPWDKLLERQFISNESIRRFHVVA